jgi:hypothetical protein
MRPFRARASIVPTSWLLVSGPPTTRGDLEAAMSSLAPASRRRVRHIYVQFGGVFSPETEARTRGYLAQQRARYGECQQRYGVPSERVA